MRGSVNILIDTRVTDEHYGDAPGINYILDETEHFNRRSWQLEG